MSDFLVFNRPFSFYAPDNKSTLDRLESLLGLDHQFTARLEIAKCLSVLLEYDFSPRQEIEHIRKEYLNASQNILKPASGPVPKGRGDTKDNPIKGDFLRYPIPALLLEPPKDEIKEQLFSIKSLVLVAVILVSSRKYIDIATRIRRALTKKLLPIKTIELIPTRVTFSELKILFDALALIQDSDSNSDIKDILFAKDLSIVIKDIQNATSTKANLLDDNYPIVSPKEENTNEPEKKDEQQDKELKLKSVQEPSKAWIRNRQKLTPNNYSIFLVNERRSLVNFLNQGMQSSEISRQNAAAIILFSYLTGQEIDTVLDLRYGDKGELNLRGEYCRKIKIPDGAFVPKDDVTQLRSRTKIIKLPLPASIIEWLSTLPNTNKRLVDCLDTNADELKHNAKGLLKQLKKTAGLNRIHQAKISAALHLELTLLYRDESLTHIIAGRANHAQPPSSFYICHDVSFLQRGYALAINKLLEGSTLELKYKRHIATYAFDKSQSVSGIYPSSELIASLPKNALAKLEACKQSQDIVDIHNAYVDYCLAILMTGTAHRPVEDPFPKLSHIDLQNNLILISDKVSSKGSPWRIAGIPNTAIKQIEYYQQYLKALPSKLLLSDLKNSANQIAKFLSGSQDLLPLFFYLNRHSNAQIESVTQKRMNERWKKIWTLPPNFTRHITATELMKLTGSGEIVKMQLGHNYDSLNQFGKCSTIPPLNFFSSVSKCLDQILQENGWRPIKSPIRTTILFSGIEPTKRGSTWNFGFKKREIDRRNRHQNALETIRKVSINLFDKKNLNYLSAAEVKELILVIKQDAGLNKEKKLKALRLLIRNGSISEYTLNDKFAKGINKIESSPFCENSIQEYLNAQRVRENWFSYLNAPRETNGIEYESRLAEIAVSAALTGGLHNAYLLENLHNAIPHVLFNINDTVLIDFSEYSDTKYLQRRWFSEKITTGLVLSLSKITKGNFRRPNEKKYLASLSVLLQKILPDNVMNKADPFEFLVKFGQTLAKFELPGFLRDYASGAYKSASLPLSTLIRTEQNMALDTNSNIVNNSYGERKYWVPSLCNLDGSKGARAFKKRFSDHKKNIENMNEGATQTKNNRCKKKLYDLIESDFLDDISWRFDSKLIAGFAIFLCAEGTIRKKNPAYNTVVQYTNIIIRLFVKYSEDADFFSKNPSLLEWEFIYADALENTFYKKRAKVTTVLYQFHRFLTLKHGFKKIDWAPIYKAMEADLGDVNIDANFVSLSEYKLLLDMLLKNESMNEFKRGQIALIAMFGYRFGTRISEAHGALSRDIIDGAILTLIIKQNYLRGLKKFASPRNVSIDAELTNTEKNLVQRYSSYSQHNFNLDNLSPFFLSSDGKLREVVSKNEATKIIHTLLREITGDNSLCYHQLRHSKVTASVESKLIPLTHNFKEFDKTILNRNFYPLHEIAVGNGHANDTTTLVSYTHCLDKLILEWLPDCESNLNDRGVAYILSMEYNSVRKKRLQSKSTSMLSTHANKQLLRLLPVPEINLKQFNVGDFAESNETSSTSLSLLKLANMLFRYTETTMSIVDFLDYQCEPKLKIQNLVESLCEFEQEFGYDIFQINKRRNINRANNEKNHPIVITATEFNGSTKTLKIISKHKFVENRHINGLANDLKIWIRTFHPRSHSNLLNNKDEYYRLRMLLMNYFDSPPVVLNFESQSTAFPTETLCKAPVIINYKKLPRAIEKVSSLQPKTAQLIIQQVRKRNICLMSIFIIGSYVRFMEKEMESDRFMHLNTLTLKC